MIRGLHHVGVAVRDLAAASAFWRDTLGLPLVREAELPAHGVRAALLACGACEIELLEPIGADSGVGRFLDRRGEGLHHLCLESDDVGREVDHLVSRGVEMIDRQPRPGLAGRVAFLHPRSCAGVLVEVATPPAPKRIIPPPLTVTVVHLIVEHVREATHHYRDLFGLPIRISHPDWSLAQVAAAGVALQLATPGATAGKPGLSMLRLMTQDVEPLAARLDASRVAYRRDAVGLVLGPRASHGVPLIIHKPQS